MPRNRFLACALLAACTTLATPAFAQDSAPMSADAPAAKTTDGFDRDAHFNGVYVQGFGGVSIIGSGRGDTLSFDRDGDGSYDDTVTTSLGANAFAPGFCNGRYNSALAGDGCRDDTMKGEYGARIGFDVRSGNIVYGALIEGNKSNSTDSTTGFSSTPAAYQIDRRVDYGISARARLGFTPMGGALFYATGGGTYARIRHSFITTNTANSFTPQRDSAMVWGWQGGGGAEIMVTNNISLGLEYLYTRYTDNKYSVNVGQGTALPTNPFVLGGGTTNLRPTETQFSTQAFRAVVGFRF